MRFPFRAVLFDLDGTLIDSAVGIAEAVNRTLLALGHAAQDESTVRSWIGDGARLLLRRALDHAGATLPDGDGFEAAYALLMRHYGESLPQQAVAYPGAAQALRDLKAAGARVALPDATRYRLVGVGLSNFHDPEERAVQAQLFEMASCA